MGLLWLENYDWTTSVSQLALRWTGGVGSGVIFTTAASQRFGVGGARNLGAGTSDVSPLFANTPTVDGSIAFYHDNDDDVWIMFRDGAAVQCTIQIRQTVGIQIRSGGKTGTIVASAAAPLFALDTWNSIQFTVEFGASGRVEVRLNGNPAPVINASGINTRGGTANDYFNVLQLSATGTSTWLDDVALFDRTSPGQQGIPTDTRVFNQVAAGAGNSTQFSRVGGSGSNWSAVATNDGDTSYVHSNTPGQIDLYTLTPLPSTPATIYGVQPYALLRKSDAGARTSAVRIRSGSTEVNAQTNAGISQTYSFQSGEPLAQDPDTGAAWTPTAVGAFQVGVKVEA